jgi:hypothetical protein
LIAKGLLNFTLENVLSAYEEIYRQIEDEECSIYLLNSITKILAKNNFSYSQLQGAEHFYNYFIHNQYPEV